MDKGFLARVTSPPLNHDTEANLMNNESDKNYISVGSWMLMMLVTAIPCIGLIMIFVWAFTGDNESRKNYYRAILAWVGVVAVLFVILALIGQWPAVQKQIEGLLHRK